MANGVSNAPQAAAGGVTQLIGDVTAGPGSGSVVATIPTSRVPLMRYGRVLVTGDGTTNGKTVTFSTPFPTACDAVVFVSNSNGSVSTATVFIVGSASASAFNISAGTTIWTNGQTFGFEYIAFGH